MVQRHKVPFVLASSAHGPIILNRIDWRALSKDSVEFGVGTDILVNGEFDLPLISLTLGVLETRRRERGAGVLALDVGANIGVYSMEWARAMEGWGSVLSFEPQERMFYALAGNLALNNLFNVKAMNKAVGRYDAVVDMPAPDYQLPGQFGGLALNGQANIGQAIPHTVPVELVTIDSLDLRRVDFIKIDIEGMEVDALEGALKTIERTQPVMLIEHHIAGEANIRRFLAAIDYDAVTIGMNMVCAPPTTDILDKIRGINAANEGNA